jgi:membrane glycosyltransferase
MAPRLGGSWEESPPSLIDAAVRDRRWAQGNMQHAKVVAARGLSWPSRVHMAIGIMSYWASPVWLLLIACGFALTLQARFIQPEYFPDSFQLFPTWPSFDSERMTRLFVATMGVLLLPKAMGLARALARPSLRRGCGGGMRLVASFLAELVVSILLAPIMMVVHSRQVYEILAGRDAGWSPQRRDDGETGWLDTWRRHRWHMACGFLMAGSAWFMSPSILAWLSPTLAGLLLAVPISQASGSARVGALMRRLGLLVTPEEREPSEVLRRRAAIMAEALPLPRDGIAAIATDPVLLATHYGWVSSAPRQRGAPDPALLTASEKVMEAQSLQEALAWLEPRERVHVAGHRTMAERLMQLADGDGPKPPTVLPRPERALDLQPEPAQMRTPAA